MFSVAMMVDWFLDLNKKCALRALGRDGKTQGKRSYQVDASAAPKLNLATQAVTRIQRGLRHSWPKINPGVVGLV